MKQKAIKELDVWLSKPGNSEALLAVYLGYKSTVTITTWLTKREIPKCREKCVLEILKRKTKGIS